MAVVGLSSLGQAQLVALGRVVEVVDDHEVEPAVVVVVDEARRHRPPIFRGAAFLRAVAEGAVAVVAPELVRSVVADVEIGEAVVVVVARRHSHAVAAGGDAARLGDVSELEDRAAVGRRVQVVAKETMRQRSARRQRGVGERLAGAQHVALRQVEIEIAILVVVQQGAARSHHLEVVALPGHAVEVMEVEPGRGGRLDEPGLGRGLGADRRRRGRRREGGNDHRRDRDQHRAGARCPLRTRYNERGEDEPSPRSRQ